MNPPRFVVEWYEAGQLHRVPVEEGSMRVGRSQLCDIVLTDPYVSRMHCTLAASADGVVLVAVTALNPIVLAERQCEAATVRPGQTFSLGNTTLRVLRSSDVEEAPTMRVARQSAPARLVLRRSTRELVDRDGTLVAQFSPSEFAAFAAIVRRHPDAADHDDLGLAVWGGLGFEQYQLHRLLQRVRARLGDAGNLLENVRGAGYRLRAAVEIV